MPTKRQRSDLLPAMIFLLPGLVLFALFFIAPMLYSLRISFFEWKIVRPEQSVFVGLENYQRALSDPIFRRAIVNTLSYTVITVALNRIGSRGWLLLNGRFPGGPSSELPIIYP